MTIAEQTRERQSAKRLGRSGFPSAEQSKKLRSFAFAGRTQVIEAQAGQGLLFAPTAGMRLLVERRDGTSLCRALVFLPRYCIHHGPDEFDLGGLFDVAPEILTQTIGRKILLGSIQAFIKRA